ncbi:MAG: molybdenum cofactor guanylyltransferase [Desulfonauticus sp.]|nr:molybdenum cofactor guanylyltransferase [Desulfonauticus sp.]
MSLAKEELVGAVLAGGKSSRLGVDKTSLVFKQKTFLARSVFLLKKVVSEVYVLGKSPDICGLDGVFWLEDEFEDIGPIAGIYTGLKKIAKPLLVISCDLPFLDDATLNCLKEVRDKRRTEEVMTTFVHPKTGFIESLVAIYEPESLIYLEVSIQKGIFKLSKAIPEEKRIQIPWTGDRKVFFNINYPQDLEVLGEEVY